MKARSLAVIPNLHFNYDLTKIKGAEYNPRFISETDLEALRESIRTLGMVKPIIARGGTTVAGHQRSKALLSMGVSTAPVYLLPHAATEFDEVSFNQLHNGTDMDHGDENAHVQGGFPSLGWHVVPGARLAGNFRAGAANVRNMIGRLVNRFGPWGACVATQSGDVIHCAQYALLCGQLMQPLTCYVVPDEEREKYASRLSKTYGVFSYEHLPRETYIQSMAQMYRLREGSKEGKLSNLSALYESMVIPTLTKNPELRVLDFGSGQGDYARHCRARGWKVMDFEPFRRTGGKKEINLSAVNLMVDMLVAEIRRNGLFDAVVCDSVLNSVDTTEAERAVVTMLNAFCKPGGSVWVAGRDKEDTLAIYNETRSAGSIKCRLVFLDENGFHAQYRDGRWFYQKFHTERDLVELGEHCGLSRVPFPARYKINADTIHMHYVKARALPWEQVKAAAAFEFNMPVNKEGRRLGRHEDVIAAMAEIQ